MRKLTTLATFALASLVSLAAQADQVKLPTKASTKPQAAQPAQPTAAPPAAPAAAPLAAPAAAAGSAKTIARDYATLPSFESKLPSQLTLPAKIPAGEKVDGVYLEMPEYARKSSNKASRYVQIFASAEDAKARNSGQGAQSYSGCFQTGSPSVDGDRDLRWNGSLSPYASIAPYPRSYGENGPNLKDMATVYPLMTQRLTDKTADTIQVETKIVLVDADTLGARLVAEEKADYVLIKQIPGRIRVYANRDADEVTFLVRTDRHPDERFSIGSMFVSQNFNSVSASEGCHMSFKLRAQQEKAATATANLDVLMEVKPLSSDDSPKVLGEMSRAVGFRGTEPKEARIRAMQIGFSTSWMSLDKAPVISVSHGWIGRERTQQM